ncbi:MAG: iron donor protein CyaY, partial [Pseudomonadales bacterium]
MDDTSFQAAVDEIFLEIEDRIDELPDDIDVDSSGGVLTLAFLDGSSVILSRQVASHEIWIAARSG